MIHRPNGVEMAIRKLGAAPDLAPTPSSGGVTRINVTPLVDVLLVLVVVGLVAFGVSRRSLPVHLAADAPAGPVATPIVLELADQGGYRLNGQAIPGAQLSDQLAAVFGTRQVKVLFIKMGPNRSPREFIHAAEVARQAGVATIAVVGGGAGG